MIALVGKGWTRVCARWSAARNGLCPEKSAAITDRTRALYDTARKQAGQPTKQWLREHGVLDDWGDR